jgi:hypothetical protein
MGLVIPEFFQCLFPTCKFFFWRSLAYISSLIGQLEDLLAFYTLATSGEGPGYVLGSSPNSLDSLLWVQFWLLWVVLW